MGSTRIITDRDWASQGSPGLDIASSRAWVLGTSFSNPVTADQNRLAIFCVANEDSSGSGIASALDVGAQSATLIQRATISTGFSNDLSFFYLTESQLSALGTSETISVTFSDTPDAFNIAHVILANVNQSSPIAGTDTATGTNVSGDTTLTADAEDGGASIAGFAEGTDIGGSFSVTTSGFVLGSNITFASGSGAAFELIDTPGPTQDCTINLSSTANRVAFVLANLRKA